MRNTSAIFATLAMAMLAVPAAASASEAGVTSLASCDAHYANTAAWANCYGGSQKSWVRLGYNCGVGPFNADHHTDWVVLDPYASRTISAECNVRVNSSWYNSRAY